MSLILKNATYIDHISCDITKLHLKVNENEQLPLEFFKATEMPPVLAGDVVVDCEGKFVTRSFACGHHHAYSALARGMGGPLKPPANFYETLKYLWWALDKSLGRDAVEASAYATAIACAKNGVTFIIDHHASPFASVGSLEIIANAFDKVGVSHLLCYEISDRDGEKPLNDGFDATEQYLEKNQGLVGLHASFTISDTTLARAVSMAEKYNSGIHVHTAEDLYDQTFTKQTYGKSVVERFYDAGVLQFGKTILVHCLHLSENERQLIANSPVYVAENIESNLNNNVGFFNGKGINSHVMLGTDGMHSNMLRSLKAAYIIGQTSEQLAMTEACERLNRVHEYMATNNFNGDAANNLVVLDYASPTPVTKDNYLGHLVFGIESADILHVIANGKLIVKDRKLLTVDEESVMKNLQKTAAGLWNVYKNQKV